MTAKAFRFEFEPSIQLTEAELSLHLALYAVEGLYGEARVRLDASYHLDEAGRGITVDCGTEVGAAVVQVFTRLLSREFGEDAFRVRRTEDRGSAPIGSSPSQPKTNGSLARRVPRGRSRSLRNRQHGAPAKTA